MRGSVMQSVMADSSGCHAKFAEIPKAKPITKTTANRKMFSGFALGTIARLGMDS